MLVQKDPEIVYPDSDGKPMAENTLQFDWIQTLVGNLKALYADREDVFVSGDQLWYPVEGNNKLCQAPDVYVVFGRPKGYRGSWKQWEENDTPMTVVFEIVSPGNDLPELIEKFNFYDAHGVEEYYIFDPERNRFWPYVRASSTLVIRPCPGRQFISPRLGVRFDLSGEEMIVFHPDGRRFLTYPEMVQLHQRSEQERQRAEQERQRAEQERQRADQERQKAEQERQKAEQERQEAEERLARLTFLAGRFTAGQATPAEITEFQRLIAHPTA